MFSRDCRPIRMRGTQPISTISNSHNGSGLRPGGTAAEPTRRLSYLSCRRAVAGAVCGRRGGPRNLQGDFRTYRVARMFERPVVAGSMVDLLDGAANPALHLLTPARGSPTATGMRDQPCPLSSTKPTDPNRPTPVHAMVALSHAGPGMRGQCADPGSLRVLPCQWRALESSVREQVLPSVRGTLVEAGSIEVATTGHRARQLDRFGC